MTESVLLTVALLVMTGAALVVTAMAGALLIVTVRVLRHDWGRDRAEPK